MNARVINHDEAVNDLMAERYLLGELNTDERDAYEQHLFSCDACFDQVKAGTEFVSHLRHIDTQDAHAPLAPGFMSQLMTSARQFATMTAFILLICVAGISIYQQRTINGLRRPQVTPSFFLSDGARAEGVKTLVLPPNTRFELSIQLMQSGDFSYYQGQVLDQSGRLKWSFPISPEQTKDTIHLLLDSSVLAPGTYSIVVSGFTPDGQKTEITRYSFQLQSKE
jgi:putative zinc finger protein